MVLIRKHSSVLALLAVLLMCAAVPYFVPEDPDSAVFRSGTFGVLVLFACFVPIQQAFRKASARTLVCALGFGLLFGFALSLGAELRFYVRLLPGMGSMLRRLAVPVMAAPFIGGLAARAMIAREEIAAKPAPSLSIWAYMGILVLCWLPLLIAFFPGLLNYDLETEYRQFYYGEWDGRHPLLYIVICYAIYGLGRLIDQPELALFAVTLIRMLSFAAALAYSCVFLQRRRAPRTALFLLTAAYAILPVFSVMSISAAKDTPFTAALIMLTLFGWEAIEDPKTFFENKKKCVLFGLMILFIWHLRKNGVAALLMLPLLIAAVRGYRAKMAKLCAVSLAATLLLDFGLNAVFKPFDQPSFQLYSLPAQQLVRAYNVGDMTEEEKAEMLTWYLDDDWGLRLYPYLADAAKGYIIHDKLAENPGEFMDLWKRVGAKNKLVYTEAFLMLNIGSWYPDDLTHTTIYRDTTGMLKGYLQTNEFDLHEYEVNIPHIQFLQPIRSFVNKICRYNEYQKYPIVTQLFCTATPLWILLFACAMLIAFRRSRCLPVIAGVMTLWISYLFGPCTLSRYILPLYCFAPVLLILAFCPDGREKTHPLANGFAK